MKMGNKNCITWSIQISTGWVLRDIYEDSIVVSEYIIKNWAAFYQIDVTKQNVAAYESKTICAAFFIRQMIPGIN